MTVDTTFFLVGATGYLGGAVLTRLLGSPNSARYHVTALVRSGEKARVLRTFGVHALVGSLDDVEQVTSLAAQADVVIECADADHIKSTNAILAGLRQRYIKTGRRPALIHTSGTGVLSDRAAGMYATSIIYYDSDPEQMGKIAPTQPHRNVDLAVVEADSQGYVNTYIVMPSTIYGVEDNPLVQAGIVNPQSQQIPQLIKASIARGRSGMVGLGANYKPNVHIDDVAHLYEVIWNAVIARDDIGHGVEGYYFGENGEHTLLSVGEEIGMVLLDMGLVDAATPTTFTPEEIGKLMGGSDSQGANSRCKAERSRAIGWKAEKSTGDMRASIRAEVEYMLSKVPM